MSNAPGFGAILIEEKSELRWIQNLSENSVKESFVLQPGNYRVVFRPKNSQSSLYTIEKTFRIASGSSISVNLN